MPDKIDKLTKALVAAGETEAAARTLATAQFSDSYHGTFNDAAIYDPTTRRAVSIRDGVLEYLGLEINMRPPDQTFRIYRSPATISNAAMRMAGVPITDEHVPLDVPPPGDGGFVAQAEMVDARDDLTRTTIAVSNELTLSDTLAATVQAGKRELSLGYGAELVPYEGDDFDFEQRQIMPHHLAVVDQGRCGPMCSFIDKKPTNQPEPDPMKNKLAAAFLDASGKPKAYVVFADAEGMPNLQQIAELVAALPEAIKAVPVDQLQKLLPALQQIVEAAKGALPKAPEGEEIPAGEGEEIPAGDEDPDKPMNDEDPDKKTELPFGDRAKAAGYMDQAAVDAQIQAHTVVVAKASDFLDAAYDYKGKSTAQIMRDALATDSSEKFADAELALAFKMLKKPNADYTKFGDQKTGSLSSLADKEL
jgi:hypothetical protein